MATKKEPEQAQANAGQLQTESERTQPKPVKPGDELVTIHLFKDNERYKDDVFVAVNGERVLIKRGETVQVKKKFADVLEQSMKQDTATANLIERESAGFADKAKTLNL